MRKGFVIKPKRAKAPWVKAFPKQARKLRSENGPAGGVRARSAPEEVRMAVYRPIAALFKIVNPWCEICVLRDRPRNPTRDIHHSRGRDGLLLFDPRWYKSACRECHEWAQSNPNEAAAVGATDLEHWRKEQA